MSWTSFKYLAFIVSRYSLYLLMKVFRTVFLQNTQLWVYVLHLVAVTLVLLVKKRYMRCLMLFVFCNISVIVSSSYFFLEKLTTYFTWLLYIYVLVSTQISIVYLLLKDFSGEYNIYNTFMVMTRRACYIKTILVHYAHRYSLKVEHSVCFLSLYLLKLHVTLVTWALLGFFNAGSI